MIGSRDRAFHEHTGYRWFVLHGAAVWVGIEMIRGFVPVIGTWGFAAYALYEQPWLIQPVSTFGIYGLSLLILLTNYALALSALALLDWQRPLASDQPPASTRHARRWLIVVGLALAVWTGLSLTLTQYAVGNTQHVRVAAIQPAFKVQTEAGLQKKYLITGATGAIGSAAVRRLGRR